MIKIMINGNIITYVDGKKDWTWVKDRWKIISNNIAIQDKLKELNKEISGINFHPLERYLNIHV